MSDNNFSKIFARSTDPSDWGLNYDDQFGKQAREDRQVNTFLKVCAWTIVLMLAAFAISTSAAVMSLNL